MTAHLKDKIRDSKFYGASKFGGSLSNLNFCDKKCLLEILVEIFQIRDHSPDGTQDAQLLRSRQGSAVQEGLPEGADERVDRIFCFRSALPD